MYGTERWAAFGYPQLTPAGRGMQRRMEDRIRQLCEQTLAEKDPKKLEKALIELRDALHQHIGHLRDKVAEYPLSIERRSRSY